MDATRRTTYAELTAEADRVASGLLGLGIGPRDRVVVHLPNRINFLSTVVALFSIGAIPVLALPGHRRDEILHLARASDAVAYVGPDRFQGFDYRALAREVRRDAPGLRHVVVDGDAAEFTPLSELARSDVRELAPVDSSEVALLLLSGAPRVCRS